MGKNQLISNGFFHAVATAAYVILVVFIMNAGQELFSQASDIQAGIGVLLLFTVSAAITGLLVFGRPVYLFLNGQKPEGVKLLFYTIGWLFVFTIIYLAILAIAA